MNTSNFIRELKTRVAESIETRETVSEREIWSKHGTMIWRARRFTGTPNFYPIYRFGDHYAYSPLSLILLKGELRLNPGFVAKISDPNRVFFSGKETIDRDIERVGGPSVPGFEIKDPGEYARRMGEAMRADAAAGEGANPGYTNVLLCSGKDSLNMLFLPWKNPVVVLSADPNFKLVKTFVEENGLKFDVVRLRDDDDSLLEREILVNCCRSNLAHYRWGHDLWRLAGSLGGKVIFWKGQLGGTVMTPFWKGYTHLPHSGPGLLSTAFKSVGRHGEFRFNRLLEQSGLRQRMLFGNLWRRGAMWQGVHNSFIRQLTNSLVLSIYHGPAVQSVVSKVDLYRAVQQDVRPAVGSYLHGGPVRYPEKNPGPPPSEFRKGISHLDPFLKAFEATGLPVYDT